MPALLADLPNLTVTYYDVAGTDPRAVRRQIQRLGPVQEEGGERFDAITRWTLDARWQTRNGVCDPSTAEADVILNIHLPRLTNYDRLSRVERARWDRYIRQLSGHERNHALSAVRGREALIRFMRAAPDCAGMEVALRDVIARVTAMNADYDRRTDHGRNEGIVY